MITYNGKSSNDFNLVLANGVSFVSPSRNLETKKVLGLDGELIIGDGTLNNINKSFPFVIKDYSKDVAQSVSDISNWLKADGLWHDLEFEGDKDFVYQAICLEEYDFERVVSFYGRGTIDFAIKPYKFLKSGLTKANFSDSITNPFGRKSRPKLTITGSGDITISIGDSVLNLKGVDNGGIIVDSLYQTVVRIDRKTPVWNKVLSYPLPTIAPGKQNITITGNVSSLEIIPRWEAIV